MKGILSVTLLFLFNPLSYSQQIDIIKYQALLTSTSGNHFTGCLGEYGVKQANLYIGLLQFEDPYTVKDSKEKDCEKLRMKIRDREDILSAYRDHQLLDYANKHEVSVDGYDQAIWNLAEWIRDCYPYEPSNLTNEQLEELFTSKHKKPGDPTTEIVMQSYFDGTIRVPKPGSEDGIIIVTADGTKTEAYNTTYNKFLNKYGNNVGNAFFDEAVTHEKQHCKLFKEGNYGQTPSEHQTHEVTAFEASKESLKKDLEKLGCKTGEGSIEYNHKIKISYGGFTQNITISGSVPFKYDQDLRKCESKPEVRGSGSVSLSMDWNAEDCVGSGSSSNSVELEGEVITENEQKFLELKFNEKWVQNMPITITCDDETDTKNMPVPPPTKYGQMKFNLQDGDNITKPFAGMGGTGTYSWTIRIQ